MVIKPKKEGGESRDQRRKIDEGNKKKIKLIIFVSRKVVMNYNQQSKYNNFYNSFTYQIGDYFSLKTGLRGQFQVAMRFILVPAWSTLLLLWVFWQGDPLGSCKVQPK